METGIELIAKERKEQIEKHHRTLAEDLTCNDNYELCHGACGLLFTPEEECPMDIIIDMGKLEKWDKNIIDRMVAKPYKERLIIAGALIAAEIDRLNALNKQEDK